MFDVMTFDPVSSRMTHRLLVVACCIIAAATTAELQICSECSPNELDILLAMPVGIPKSIFAISLVDACSKNDIPLHVQIQIGETLANNELHIASHKLFANLYLIGGSTEDHIEMGARTAMMAKQIGKYDECTSILKPLLLLQGKSTSTPTQIQTAFTFNLLAACQHRLGESTAARRTHEVAVSLGVYPSLDPIRPGGGELWLDNLHVTHPIWKHQQIYMHKHGKGIFQLVSTLEDHSSVIRNEMLQYEDKNIDEQDWNNEGQNLVDTTGSWKELYLWHNGYFDEKLCKSSFSLTCDLLRAARFELHPHGDVKFSKLYPGTYIYPHSGGSNSKLRGHLGVHVTSGAKKHAKLFIAGQSIGWRQGGIFLFDDTYEHSVEYSSSDSGNEEEARIVLIFDVFHPDVKRSTRVKLRRKRKGIGGK